MLYLWGKVSILSFSLKPEPLAGGSNRKFVLKDENFQTLAGRPFSGQSALVGDNRLI
jgi:hypothetical protein